MFVEHGVFALLLELFFTFKFNNLLHNAVTKMVFTAINGVDENARIVQSLLCDAGLIRRLVAAFDGYSLEDDTVFSSNGYYGQLKRIGCELATTSCDQVAVALQALAGQPIGPGQEPAPEPEGGDAAAVDAAAVDAAAVDAAAVDAAAVDAAAVDAAAVDAAAVDAAAVDGTADRGELLAAWVALSQPGGALAQLKDVEDTPLGGARPGFRVDLSSDSDDLHAAFGPGPPGAVTGPKRFPQ
jgi:hypothetical protein